MTDEFDLNDLPDEIVDATRKEEIPGSLVRVVKWALGFGIALIVAWFLTKLGVHWGSLF